MKSTHKLRIGVYLAMVLGVGYRFYTSANIHGIGSSWYIGLFLTLLLSIAFIEFLFHLFYSGAIKTLRK